MRAYCEANVRTSRVRINERIYIREASASTTVTRPPPSSESVPATIVETGSTSATVRPTPVVNTLEGLIIRVINQFISMIEYCTELVLSGQSSFVFVQSLLENRVETSRRLWVSSELRCTKYA